MIGHPLTDLVPKKEAVESTVLGLFPGSRKQEIDQLLPVMCESAKRIRDQFPFLTIKIAAASPEIQSLIEREISGQADFIDIVTDARKLIHESWCSIVASGTITLEHALMGTPCISLYKMMPLSYFLAMKVVWKKIETHCMGLFRCPIFYVNNR